MLEQLAQDIDPNEAIARVTALHSVGGEHYGKIAFIKHIAKFYDQDIKKEFLFGPGKLHMFLLRDPLAVIQAWAGRDDVHGAKTDWEDIGFNLLLNIWRDAKRFSGQPQDPIVVDAEILRCYPREILTELTAHMEIPFYEAMLGWQVGPKPYDGMWAPHWYHTVWKTTGFQACAASSSCSSGEKRRPDLVTAADGTALSAEKLSLYRECLPFYELLRRHALGLHPLNPGSSVLPARLLYLPLTAAAATATAAAAAAAATAAAGATQVIDDGLALAPSTLSDARNKDLLAWVGDRLLPRECAKVSVFDSAVQGGDAVWEGLRGTHTCACAM